ncbi:MAG: chemotaxis response regulator protein-glutamate methylesterase [Candidatus Eisenbacteria bacterium]
MPRIRVLIVDDAVVIRRMLTQVIEQDDALEVAGVAANGKIAMQRIPQVNPDLVTLDVEMPEMDGITTLREIRKAYPRLPVIMCSTLTAKGAATTIEALSAGATDYVTKPANVGSVVEGLGLMRDQLVPKIKAICDRPDARPAAPAGAGAAARIVRPAPPVARPTAHLRPAVSGPVEAIAIGCSTGGPNALHELFAALPGVPPVPIFITQHMPPLFTSCLAERLGRSGPVRVHEGKEGMAVLPGNAYLAPGGYHMIAKRDGVLVRLHLNEDPPENSCRPAVDVLFRSLASVYGGHVVAAVLTGMGADGTRGAAVLREKGAHVIAQDQATSVVWGMPGSLVEAGLADAVLPLARIPHELHRRSLEQRRRAA